MVTTATNPQSLEITAPVKGKPLAKRHLSNSYVDRRAAAPILSWTGPEFMLVSREQLAQIIDSTVEEKVKKALNGVSGSRIVPDSTAKQEISSMLLQLHKEGYTKISLPDIILRLRLPVFQVEKILAAFERQGKIKSI